MSQSHRPCDMFVVIQRRRSEIYDHFHASQACREYFLDPANAKQYLAYYVSMYLLQDASESLWVHRQRGFGKDGVLLAYIEFWGVMQAVVIQQDALRELHEVICRAPLDYSGLTAWQKLRDLRVECAGHPVGRGEPVVRSFMGRGFGGYERFTYERREEGQSSTHPVIALGDLFDNYATEAAGQILMILDEMKSRWP